MGLASRLHNFQISGQTMSWTVSGLSVEKRLSIYLNEEVYFSNRLIKLAKSADAYLFEAQPETYKETVLPKQLTKRIAIEMANPLGWERYVGLEGAIIGINGFGASAPGNTVVEAYGFNVENVVKQVKNTIK